MNRKRRYQEISTDSTNQDISIEDLKNTILRNYKVDDGPAKELINEKDKTICSDLVKQILYKYFECDQYLIFQSDINYEIGFKFNLIKSFDLNLLVELTKNFSNFIEKMSITIDTEDSKLLLLVCRMKKEGTKKLKKSDLFVTNKETRIKTKNITKDILFKDDVFKLNAPSSISIDLDKINRMIEDVCNMNIYVPLITTQIGLIKRNNLIMYNLNFFGVEEIDYNFLRYFMEKYEDVICEATMNYNDNNTFMNVIFIPQNVRNDSRYKIRKN
jgi:hypothetical protein